MKRIALLLALFCAGLLAASFAFAGNGGKGEGNAQAQSSTSTPTSGPKCKNVSLKGTAAATSFTVTVDTDVKPDSELSVTQAHGLRRLVHGDREQGEQG